MNKEINDLIMSFTSEMQKWEMYAESIDEGTLSESKINSLLKKELKNIFTRYCTTKERKQGRINNIFHGGRGSYDYNPSETEITEITEKGKNFEVAVTDSKNENNYLYVIHKKSETYLIDSKKRYSSWKKKWVSDTL